MKLMAIPSALTTRRGAATQEQQMGLLDFSFAEWGSAESALELQGRMRIRRG